MHSEGVALQTRTLEAGARVIAPGGLTKLFEAGRLPGTIDLITLATLPPRERDAGAWSQKPAGSGVGLCWEEAFVTSVGEAVERLSLVPDSRAVRRLVRSSFDRIGRRALDPSRLPLYRDAQYRRAGFPFRRFTRGEEIAWYPAFSLTRDHEIWIPADCAFFSCPEIPSHHLACTSSGVASALSPHCALAAALLELVERDAFMLAWFRREPKPAVDPRAFGQADLDTLIERCEGAGVALHLRDLTTELGIPVYLAIAEAREGGIPALGIGAAARLSPGAAARKAALEAAHTWNWAYLKLDLHGPIDRPTSFADYRFGDFGDHVFLYAHDWMKPHASFLLADPEHARPRSEPSPAPAGDELAEIVRRIEAAGFEVIAVDLTASEPAALGYCVARAIVPGLVPLHLGVGSEYLAPPRVPARPNLDPHPFP